MCFENNYNVIRADVMSYNIYSEKNVTVSNVINDLPIIEITVISGGARKVLN